jgi:hypothetical protein
MNLRYYVYASIGAAALVCLVLDPELLGASSIAAFCAALVGGAREVIASLR